MASTDTAVRTGRGYIGMEMDETYFNIAKGRIENEHKAIKTFQAPSS